MISHLLSSLLITIILELFIAVIIGIISINDIKKIIFINCVTNLSGNIIVYNLNNFLEFNIVYFLITPILEIFIFLIEGKYFEKLEYKKLNNYIISLILNICSYGCGLIYTLLIY